MDSFCDLSTNNEHNSGTDETEACEKMDLKATVPKKKILVKRKRTLDVEKPPGLSRSYSFDSNLSRTRVVDAQDDPSLPPYDPIENYISPRPKYLRFNPDRHSKILARQENVSRMIKSASFDCGVLNLEDASSDDCSVEETEDLVKESLVSTHDESEGEKEEFEDGNGWSGNVLLQYLIVVILLILTTLTICLMNSPTVSHSEVRYKGFGPMMLMDGDLSENMICYDYEKCDTEDLELSSYELVERQHRDTTEVTEMEVDVNKDETDEMETRQIEAEKESYVQILGADLGQNDVNKDTDVIRNPRSMIKEETESRRTEPEKESYILGAVSGQNVVTEESEIVKPKVEEDDSTNNGPYETETEGIKDTDTLLSKLANVDPNFAAFSGVVVIILACASLLYYLIQGVTTSAHKNEVSEESCSSIGSFGSGRIYSESSNFEMSSGYSSSHGSFTVEKMIVKKQRSKTPEVTISTVRRSSRIHNRSVTQSA